jgi:hypothetical protein
MFDQTLGIVYGLTSPSKENVVTASTDNKWRGFHIRRYDAGHPDRDRVIFFPRFLQGARGPGGDPTKVGDVSREDYERKAMDLVREGGA